VQPTASRVCSHTFCFDCIAQSIATNPQCPVDRCPLLPEHLVTANPIIRHLVDELAVYCPHKALGCTHTCERQLLSAHMRDDCLFTTLTCPKENCGIVYIRKDEEAHDHRYHLSVASSGQLTGFQEESSNDIDSDAKAQGTSLCNSCGCQFDQEEFKAHSSGCSVTAVACKHSENGCSWLGPRKDVDDHVTSCPYEAIKGFFEIERRKFDSLAAENIMLREHIEKLQYTLHSVHRELALTRGAIGPWLLAASPEQFATNPPSGNSTSEEVVREPMQPPNEPPQDFDAPIRVEDFHPISTPHSRVLHNPENTARFTNLPETHYPFRPALPPPLDPSKSIYGNLSDLRSSVIALSGNLASLARLQNQSLNGEANRLNDEMASFRVILHGIRLQINSILMERNLQMSNDETGRQTYTSDVGHHPFIHHLPRPNFFPNYHSGTKL